MENRSVLLIQGKYCSGEQYPLGNTSGEHKHVGGNRIHFDTVYTGNGAIICHLNAIRTIISSDKANCDSVL